VKRVLVVDPGAEVRQLICRVLDDAKLSAIAVGAAAAALSHVTSRRPDLILLDAELAARDDWSLLARLREGDDPPPIVVITAPGMSEEFTRGVREGVAGFVSRPFHMGELVDTCRRAIEAGERRSLEPEIEERRRDARRPLQIAVHLLSEEGAPMALGELLDFSNTGAQVILVAPFEVGSLVRVSIDPSLTGRLLELQGTVRWQSRVATGFSHGLEFNDLSPAAQQQLEQLCSGGEED